MKPQRTADMIAFLQEQRDIFWHHRKDRLHELSDDAIVEQVLNYGDYEAVKKLLAIWGTEHVAEVFNRNTAQGRRVNYFPEVRHFFDTYFQRHASGYSDHGAAGHAAHPA